MGENSLWYVTGGCSNDQMSVTCDCAAVKGSRCAFMPLLRLLWIICMNILEKNISMSCILGTTRVRWSFLFEKVIVRYFKNSIWICNNLWGVIFWIYRKRPVCLKSLFLIQRRQNSNKISQFIKVYFVNSGGQQRRKKSDTFPQVLWFARASCPPLCSKPGESHVCDFGWLGVLFALAGSSGWSCCHLPVCSLGLEWFTDVQPGLGKLYK